MPKRNVDRARVVAPATVALLAFCALATPAFADASRDAAADRAVAQISTVDAAIGDASRPDATPSLATPPTNAPHATPSAEPPAPAHADVGKVARVVLGLLGLFALALIAGHRKVAEFERRVGLSMIAATGIPFVLLGVLARSRSVGILSDEIVAQLRPMLEFGLGWIGFRVGTAFDVRELDRLPRGAARLLSMESTSAFVVASVGSALALTTVGLQIRPETIRDGLILGACAAVSAPSGARALEAVGVLDTEGSRLIRKIVALDDIVPIIVLALVTALFRPFEAGGSHLPPLGWVFLQIGMGAALGMLTVAMVRAARNINEEVALTLGVIAFASGMAGYLGFSPLSVGCVAGIVLTNLTSGPEVEEFQTKLRDLERPIFMAFFVVTGAVWDVRDWRGWAIVPLFVVARLFGKLAGARAAFMTERREIAAAARRATDESPDRVAARVAESSWIPAAGLADARSLGVAMIPTSAVSIAVVISAHQSYPRAIAPYLETIVIVGAFLAELIFQISVPRLRDRARRVTQAAPPPPPPPSSPPEAPGAA